MTDPRPAVSDRAAPLSDEEIEARIERVLDDPANMNRPTTSVIAYEYKNICAELLATIEARDAEIERLKEAARWAATGLAHAIRMENGLDGREGEEMLTALAECGIAPDPFHEVGCTFVTDGVSWTLVCVESCHYYARSVLTEGETT